PAPAPKPTPAPAPKPTPTTPATPAPLPALEGTASFPAGLVAGSPPTVRVGCSRDCLYLVTLERAGDGKPVRATRATLRGGAPARAVPVPEVPFAPGSYRLTVRLVAQAAPGPLWTQTSGVLSAT